MRELVLRLVDEMWDEEFQNPETGELMSLADISALSDADLLNLYTMVIAFTG